MKNYLRSFFIISIMVQMSLHADVTRMSEKEIREAAQKMTIAEKNPTEAFLKDKVAKAKNEVEKQRYEELLHEFYKERYDLVMQELKELGDDPQKILKTTGLRQKALSGELEKTPWFIREIAGLDWFFEQDAKLSTPKWSKAQDKALYLISLADQIDRNHTRVSDDLLLPAITDLTQRLSELRTKTTKVFQRSIDQALDKLKAVREMRQLSSVTESQESIQKSVRQELAGETLP